MSLLSIYIIAKCRVIIYQLSDSSCRLPAAGYQLPAVGFRLSTYTWVRVFQSFHKAVNHSSQLIQPLIDFICPLFAHIASTGCNIYLRLQFI